VRNLANTLTMSRIIMTVAFIWMMTIDGFFAKFIAMCLFVLASVTDFYDGYVARKFNTHSDFGKLMDPIAYNGQYEARS